MAKQREAASRRPTLVSVLMLVIMLAVTYVSVVAALTPKRYDVGVGTVVNETITATRTIEHSAATEALKNAARSETAIVYKLDETLAEEKIEQATTFFSDIAAFRQDANALRLLHIEGTGLRADGSLSISDWQSLISAEEMNTLTSDFTVPLSEEQTWWLLHVEDSELLRLQDAVLPKLTTSLRSGLEKKALPARKSACLQELNATSISDALKGVGERVYQEYLVPTFVPDEVATERAREAAADKVVPIQIKRGDVIVEKGAAVTEEQMVILRELELVRSEQSDLKLDLGVAAYLLCVYGLFAAYLVLYRPRVFQNNKSMLIMGIEVSLVMLMALLVNSFNARITPGLYAVMIVAILLDGTTAMAVNVVLSLCIGLLSGGRGSNTLGFSSLTMMASMLASGQMAIYALKLNQKRSAIIGAGAVAGVAGALVIAATYVMTDRGASAVLVDAAWSFGSSVISAILVVGTLSLWENLFDVATSARLSELSNTNHPLLRQLMTEAPGTYHHSMMTASLAESAAQAIDADPLLARVGAYYHDVGKLRRPMYFSENQKPTENIHDTLPAAESAGVIIAHQKDSVTLLNKHKLPSAVAQIAFEHHGNTLVAYFYHKALQEAGGKRELNQKTFRYPGARPGSAESAIVMLADSCEAAVRSLQEPNREAVEEMVHKVIKGKLDDGQLALSPLTFADISQIEMSFLRTFNGMMHGRVEYPGQAKKKRG